MLRSHNRLLSTPLDPDVGHSVEFQKQGVSILTCWERPRMKMEAWVEVIAWLICCPTSSSRELGKSIKNIMDGERCVCLVSPPQETFLHPEKQNGE